MTEHSAPTPRRILVFGGTFDPPHLAHVMLPAQAARHLNCDLLLYVPVAINPLKTKEPTASREDRLAMLLLAIADVSNAKISTIELDRAVAGSGGPSYTIDTLRALHKEFERAHDAPEFRLLIGCDQALDFHRWKDWQEIRSLAPPAVMLRPPWDEQAFHNALKEKYSTLEADMWMRWSLRLPSMNISATEIRAKLRAGDREGLLDLLPRAVLDYALSNNVYAAAPEKCGH